MACKTRLGDCMAWFCLLEDCRQKYEELRASLLKASLNEGVPDSFSTMALYKSIYNLRNKLVVLFSY